MSEDSDKSRMGRIREGVSSAAGNVRNLVGDPGFIFMFFGALTLFFLDWYFYGFGRSAAHFSILLTLYTAFGVGAYFRLANVEGSGNALKRVISYTALTLLGPPLLRMIGEFSFNLTFATSEPLAQFLALLTHSWAPVVLLYMLWPRFMMSVASQKWKVLTAVNITIFTLLFTLFVSIAIGPLLGQGFDSPQDVPTPWEVVVGIWEYVRGVGQETIQTGRNVTETQIERAMPTYYTGQVESSQGRSLGVYVTGIQSFLPEYTFDVQGTGRDAQVLPPEENEQIQWFGEIQAQTFASMIPVNISCWYEIRRGRDPEFNDSVSAQPAELRVRYTGEARDYFPFTCAFPMSKIPIDSDQEFLSGQFSTRTHFTFDTWGYTTFWFMDAEERRALQQENKDPARELGISRRSTALYTPGPISLGMADTSLPISVDAENQDSTALPPMGVTIQNAWAGRGHITDIEYVVLQIPEPFELDHDSGRCSGLRHEFVDVLGPENRFFHQNFQDGDQELVVPDGYTWYVFTGVEPPQQGTFITIRCPLTVSSGGWLLNPDLSARQFTFVSMVKYDFETQSPAPIRLSLRRDPTTEDLEEEES